MTIPGLHFRLSRKRGCPALVPERDPGVVLRALAGLMAGLVVALAVVPAAAADDLRVDDGATGHRGQVLIAVLPNGIAPTDLSELDGAALGLMNPGLGEVPAEQTWLDVSQGARAFDSSYDTPLGSLSTTGEPVVGWQQARKRARTAPGRLLPGLLASVLARSDLNAVATDRAGTAALALARLDGSIARAPLPCGHRGKVDPGAPGARSAVPGCPDPVTLLPMSLQAAVRASRNRRAGDLQIFIERPPALPGEQLSIAIAGPGTEGMLQSPSTRTAGYVLSTDLAPTILRHFRIREPKAMTGLPISSGGQLDLERLAELQGRYEQIGKRKGATLAIPLLLWAALALLVSLASRGLYARPALRLLCLSVVLLPGVLLFTAALEPSLAVERAIATLLPVILAALLMRLFPGWPSLAVACGLTVIPYGLDMLAGSALTPRAVTGPNPGLGARFYGIGNELESTLMVLTSIGAAAGLTSLGIDGKRAAAGFILAGLVATVVFAAGRFGADVGAAIVFPVAAVVATALAAGRPRLAWAGLAVAAAALLLVALADLLTGSETHFVRSVFGGGGGSLGGLASDRLGATLDSFTRVSRLPYSLATIAVIGLGLRYRQAILAWLEEFPVMRAGIAAAAAGSVVGALANDSGVLFIQVGTLFLALVLGFTWTTTGTSRS